MTRGSALSVFWGCSSYGSAFDSFALTAWRWLVFLQVCLFPQAVHSKVYWWLKVWHLCSMLWEANFSCMYRVLMHHILLNIAFVVVLKTNKPKTITNSSCYRSLQITDSIDFCVLSLNAAEWRLKDKFPHENSVAIYSPLCGWKSRMKFCCL